MAEAKANYLTPMNEKIKEFIEVENEDIFNKNWCDPSKRGKWMMFFPTKVMNRKWQKSLSLYNAEELTGIQSMKCSTSAPNPRAGNRKLGVIRFACGPYDNEALVISYGKNLIAKMGYTSDFGFLAYKTDVQSDVGTVATGAKKNYLHRIHVPTYDPESDKNEQSVETWGTKAQSNNCTYKNQEIASKFPYESDNLGMWVMAFSKAWVEISWKKACDLYDGRKLPGVVYLKKSVGNPLSETGAVMFFCEKATSPREEMLLKGYGKTMAEKMNYVTRDGNFHFMVFAGDSTSKESITISVLSPSNARV